jgi:inosine-uridine nucleoside N-ribohydrolase
MVQHCLGRGADCGPQQFIVHDAIAVGLLLWPELFIRARMALDITTKDEQAGRCKPKVAGKSGGHLSVTISINAGAFLENLLEQLCHEKFVV